MKTYNRHNLTHHKDYQLWLGMKQRCYNSNQPCYKNYGGRGIKICDRWLESFANFLEDMGERPNKNYSLDRIDGNGNYEPGNCKWATRTEQNRNQRAANKNISGIRGVSYDRVNQKWQVYIAINRKKIDLGRYSNIFVAARARQLAEDFFWHS